MKLYNTLSRKQEELQPPESKKSLTFYACGPTVYDETHIGHMRKYTMDDILKRSLTYLGYNVDHVMNITDVGHLSGDDDSGEDKLEKGAKKHGKTVWDVAKYYTDIFFETTDALNIERPVVVKATDHIAQMIYLINKLEEKGFTYQTNEAVYFDVTKFADYGKLSGQKLEDKKQAVRKEVNIDPEKKHPADFALWFKRVGRFADHTMHWNSPWGEGFPGWHIECSAMSMDALHTATIDIHSGGIDHIPVHHENEIAQSEAATGKKPFVKYWVHHNFLQVAGEKMSKSKENFYTLKDLKDHNIDPLAIRYLFLQTHYRQEMNFTWEAADAAQEALVRLKKYVVSFRESSNREKNPELANKYLNDFQNAIENDLNTAQALGVMWEVMKSELNANEKLDLLYTFDRIFGFGFKNISSDYFTKTVPEEILNLANERVKARAVKNFEKSDELRKLIEEKGYTIEDVSTGFKIEKK
jgi:cysteinyl-tRNA synthetase